jgi:hypothetical protein
MPGCEATGLLLLVGAKVAAACRVRTGIADQAPKGFAFRKFPRTVPVMVSDGAGWARDASDLALAPAPRTRCLATCGFLTNSLPVFFLHF